MASPFQVNSLALLALMDWPQEDADTVLPQIQHFVRYVHTHPNDYATVDKVWQLAIEHERADYAFSVGFYNLVGWPEGMSARD